MSGGKHTFRLAPDWEPPDRTGVEGRPLLINHGRGARGACIARICSAVLCAAGIFLSGVGVGSGVAQRMSLATAEKWALQRPTLTEEEEEPELAEPSPPPPARPPLRARTKHAPSNRSEHALW
jgi:hypothetical protein